MTHRHTLDGEYALETILSIRTGSRKRGKQSRIGTRRNSEEKEESGKRGEGGNAPKLLPISCTLEATQKIILYVNMTNKMLKLLKQRTNDSSNTRLHD